jgi:hypothetical protein
MNSNDRARKYLQIFFFVSIVAAIAYLYVLQKAKSGDGVSRFFPGISVQQRKDFYPDGSIRAIGMIKGFEKNGQWIYYNPKGEVELVEVYDNGKLISSEKPSK